MRSRSHGRILIAMRIDAQDSTLTNGRYELPRSARGVLVLADPPEAGWRMRATSSEHGAGDAELLTVAGRGCDGPEAGDTCALEDGGRG
jgi:hypothetical protein